jgi:acyl-CoA thioesterase-1
MRMSLKTIRTITLGLSLGVLLSGMALAEPIRIVAFGGSNTFGTNLPRGDSYPAQLEALLKAAGHDVVIKNEGTNGQTTAEELQIMDSAVPPGTQIVIFQPGGNDKGKRAVKSGAVIDTAGNIETMVQRFLDRKVLVLFSGVGPRRDALQRFDIAMINEINRLAPEHLQADGEHLTAQGYAIVAQKMMPKVVQLIEKLPAR